MTWRVADVMTTEVVTVGPETGFKSCVDMLRVHSISALPVIAADGALLGIVSEFDLMLKEEGHDRQQRPSRPGGARMAAELMSSPPICVQPGGISLGGGQAHAQKARKASAGGGREGTAAGHR